MAKSWTPQDDNYLKRYAAGKNLEELVQRFEAEPDEVRARLAELELVTKDGEPVGGVRRGPDPMVATYEEAMKALYAEKWKKAAELLESVVADSDQPELTARARQMLSMARTRLESDEDVAPYLKAVYAKNRGELDTAMEVASSQKDDEEGRFAYLRAAIHAVRNETDKAAKELEAAARKDSRNTVSAFHDPDFAELRKDKQYSHLFGLE